MKNFFKWKKEKRWSFSYFQVILIWNPLVTLLICLLTRLNNFKLFWLHWIISLFIATIIANIYFLVDYFLKKLTSLFQPLNKVVSSIKDSKRHAALTLLIMPSALYIALLMAKFVFNTFGVNMRVPSNHWGSSLLLGGLITGIIFLRQAYDEAKNALKTAELKAKSLENENLRAQISALTAQMNPHLLFNALNTVASLIPSEPQKAEETILQLSELYRGVLNSSRKVTHSLAEELALCRAYLAIEQVRFGNRLQTEMVIQEKLIPEKWQIPVLLIQPFVENALKHGVSSGRVGHIRIMVGNESEKLKITIEDDGSGFSSPSSSKNGVGISNCEQRLKLSYGETAKLSITDRIGGGTIVSLIIPLSVV